MRPAVISNLVPFARGPCHDLRMFRYVFADHEERCFHMMGGKNIEEFRGQRGTRAVVKSHCDVGSIDMDGIESDTRFRRSVLVISFCILGCNPGLRSNSMRRD